MSWVDKEVKKRTALAARDTTSGGGRTGGAGADLHGSRIAALWDQIEAANNALPAELKLPAQGNRPDDQAPGRPPFRQWLKAPNGAGLGFNGDAIRYHWPQPNRRKSNNFWIRWEAEMGYVVCRRVGQSQAAPRTDKLRFDETRIELMLRYLVTGRRIKPRTIRRRRFWLF